MPTTSISMRALVALSLFALGCSDGGEGGPGPTTAPTTTDPTAGDEYAEAWDAVRPIVEAKCARCHTADRLSTYRRLETHAEVIALRSSIIDKTSPNPPRGLRMPLASNHVGVEGCTPDHPPINDKRLTDEELTQLVDFLERTNHEDFVDDLPPITAPQLELAGAVEYTSSQFDVLNDGFITPPNGAPAEYMEELGYDERDFDQMEDDWFCIEFDPMQTEVGYVTGTQVLTEIGQIFLNAQLVIDTTGGSTAAKAAATEKGQDWYRCEAGLGFADAIPLWRTVPGGGPVELPDQTGLRFEPGWRFVLRADFHTHFDADEFERLDQKGVIDRDAGTMTWFNRRHAVCSLGVCDGHLQRASVAHRRTPDAGREGRFRGVAAGGNHAQLLGLAAHRWRRDRLPRVFGRSRDGEERLPGVSARDHDVDLHCQQLGLLAEMDRAGRLR